MRILGLDIGEKNIGVSISDPLCLFAQPLETLNNDKEVFYTLKIIVVKREVKEIVCGLPYTLRGEIGKAGNRVLFFVSSLREKIGVPVFTIDERLTTSIAEKVLKEAKVNFLKRRLYLHKMAACLILQSYLDSQ